MDDDDQTIAEIPYIDLRVIQAGTEEKKLSNEHQPIPFRVVWKFNLVKLTSIFHFRLDLDGVNVVEIQRYAKFVSANQKGKWFQITNLANGFSVKERLPEGLIPDLDDELYSIIDDLVFIQKKTRKAIKFHGEITRMEWCQMKDLVQILSTGSIREDVPKYTLSISKDSAVKLASAFEKNGPMKWEFEGPIINLRFFGVDIDLGPRSIVLPSATLEPETRKMLSEIGKLPDDSDVDITLDLGGQGIVNFFHNWFSSDNAP